MLLRPLWFVTFGPSPAFPAIFLINELSLFWPTADFLNQGLERILASCLQRGKMERGCRSFLLVVSLRIICRQQRDLFHFQEPKIFSF